MKKQFLTIILLFKLQNVFAQVSTGFNTFNTTNDYVGWNTTVNSPDLNIKHELNQPIHFYTNAGNGTFNNMKMSIMSRTINGIERAGVGIHEVGNNPVTFPRSILHLGNNYFTGGVAGWRTWMDVGTFSGLQTDFAFFGIIPFDGDTTDNQADHNDAAIVWGDNVQGVDGADNLRVIFSAPMNQTTNAWETQYSALEVARFVPAGRMGVGNFTANGIGGGSGIQPVRRLEIYDEGLNLTLNPAPQLRLTFTPNANVNLGINTDFQTMNTGDLFIHPRSAGADRFVGINTSTPASVLHLEGTNAATGEVFRTDGPSGVVQNWRLYKGGTEIGRLYAPASGSNFNIGAVNNNLNFLSGNSGTLLEAMRIVGGNGANARFVGIGDFSVISAAQSQLHQFVSGSNAVFHQFTNGNTGGSNSTSGFKLGLAGNSDAEIYQYSNAHILFYTNDGTSTAERVRIQNNGKMGVGLTSPVFNLTVNHSVAIGDTAHYYQCEPGGGYYRLLSSTGGSNGYNNLTIGRQAGPDGLMTAIEANTFVGGLAGRNCASNYNTFVGSQAGELFEDHPGTSNPQNVFVGYYAGREMEEGRDNTIVGGRAAYSITEGDWNTIIGAEALRDATDGDYNTSLGHWSGIGLYDGTKNTFIGYSSGPYTPNGNSFTMATAIGAETKVGCDNCVTIGTSTERTGIGFFVPSSTGTTGAPNNDFRLYVNALNNNRAGYFNGDVYASGGYLTPSDAMLKDNIQPLANALQIIEQLNVKTYEYKNTSFPHLGLPSGTQAGLIADELINVLPQLVKDVAAPLHEDSQGNLAAQGTEFKAINYEGLIPYLVQAIKEQNDRINTLEDQLNNCCNLRIPTNPAVTGSIELENIKSLQLFTADPNPFSESTIIRWSIAENFTNAVIFFYDDRGQQINQYRITEKGNGELLVFGSKLSSGVYTYTLVKDGKIVESRKMVKVK